MGKSNGPYIFAGVRFLPDRGWIEVCETNLRVSLSQIHRSFLLALVEKPRALTTYEELRAKVSRAGDGAEGAAHNTGDEGQFKQTAGG